MYLSLRTSSFIYFLKICIGVQLIYNVVLVSGVQQSESVIYIHISTLFQILFPYRPLQSTEQSSLCSTVSAYQLSVLYIVVYMCQSNLPIQPTTTNPPPLSPLVHTFSSLHLCLYFCLANRFIGTIFLDSTDMPCVKQMASGNLRYSTGSSARCSVMTQMGGMRGEVQEGGDICIHIADSLRCTAETNTTL